MIGRGVNITANVDQGPAQREGDHQRRRRGGPHRRRRGHRGRHPGRERAGRLAERGGGSRDAAACWRSPEAALRQRDGAQRPVGAGPRGAGSGAAPPGQDARAALVRQHRAERGEAGAGVRHERDRVRPVRLGGRDGGARRRVADAGGDAERGRLRLGARPAHEGHAPPDERRPVRADEADGDLREHRARARGGRAGA